MGNSNLVKCPTCNHDLSIHANTCLNCGETKFCFLTGRVKYHEPTGKKAAQEKVDLRTGRKWWDAFSTKPDGSGEPLY